MGRKARRLSRSSGSAAAAVTDGRQAGPALTFKDFKAAFSRFRKDQITDNAAALTYYSLLALFPALLFCAAVLGVFGQQGLIDDAASYLRDAGAPQDTVDAVTGALQSAQEQRGKAIVALIVGLVISLNGASGAFGAAGRALNKIFRVEEGRGFVKHKAQDLAWTLCVMVLALITFVLIFLGGGRRRRPVRQDRARRHRRDGLDVRALARCAGGRDDDLRDRLLRGPERGGPAFPLDHAGRGGGRGAVDRRVARCSSSTSRTSRPTRRPTARSRAR